MFTKQTDYLHVIQKLQGLLDDLVRQTTEIPFWKNEELSLEELAVQIDLYDWYRCVACCSIVAVASVLARFAIMMCVFWVAAPKALYITAGALGPPSWLVSYSKIAFSLNQNAWQQLFFLNYVYSQLKGNLFSMYKICSLCSNTGEKNSHRDSYCFVVISVL